MDKKIRAVRMPVGRTTRADVRPFTRWWRPVARPSGRSSRQDQLQVSLQIDWTSPTQIESHLVEQQYESAAQILVAHGSHELTSFLPVLHSGWLHVFGGGGGGGGG